MSIMLSNDNQILALADAFQRMTEYYARLEPEDPLFNKKLSDQFNKTHKGRLGERAIYDDLCAKGFSCTLRKNMKYGLPDVKVLDTDTTIDVHTYENYKRSVVHVPKSPCFEIYLWTELIDKTPCHGLFLFPEWNHINVIGCINPNLCRNFPIEPEPLTKIPSYVVPMEVLFSYDVLIQQLHERTKR